jgi:hypothetical protein
MTNAVQDLQSMVQSLGVGAMGPTQRVEDRSAFIPNAASMRANAQKMRASSERKASRVPTDTTLQRQKIESAQAFAERIDPNGKPEPYLKVADGLKASILRDSEGEQGATTAEDTASEEPEETKEIASAKEFGKQNINMEAYSPGAQKTVARAIAQIKLTTGGEPKTITEIFNHIQFALTATERDISAYTAQEQRANTRLEQLRGRKDPKGIEKLSKTERLLTAIRADKKNAETVRDQLAVAVQEMDRLDGGRIKDGFNIIPKAFRALEHEAKVAGQQSDISATELSTSYCEQILEITNPSQFFEDFTKNYPQIEFPKYIDLSLSLLGDDIKSSNPSRGTPYLQAIRDGIFFAEIAWQMFDSVGQIGSKFHRFTRLRKMDEGTYVPRYLVVEYDGKTMRPACVEGTNPPEPLEPIRMAPNADYYGRLTEQVRDHDIEAFVVVPNPEMDPKQMRQFKNGLIVRYGCEVHDAIPQPEAQIVDSPEVEIGNSSELAQALAAQ